MKYSFPFLNIFCFWQSGHFIWFLTKLPQSFLKEFQAFIRSDENININSQSAFCTHSAVCILYLVCICTRSAVCSLHFVLTGLVLLFLFERALSANRKLELEKNYSETILASMIDMWTLCWKAHKEKYSDRAMITLYQLKRNANARLANLGTSNALPAACVEMNPLRVP